MSPQGDALPNGDQRPVARGEGTAWTDDSAHRTMPGIIGLIFPPSQTAEPSWPR